MTADQRPPGTASWVRRGLVGVGVLIMGYAVAGAITDSDVNKVGVGLFLAAMVVGHDGVFMPAVLGIGALIRRFVPAGGRRAVQAAALCTAAVTVVGLPLALGYGKPPDNPSALPLAYPRNLIVIVVVIWVVAALIRKGLARRGRRRSR